MASYSHKQIRGHTHSLTNLAFSHTEERSHSFQFAFTQRLEGTLTHSLSLSHSLQLPHSLTHSFTHLQISHTEWIRMECKLTHSVASHSHTHSGGHTHSRTSHSYTQRWWRAHSPTNLPFSETEGWRAHLLTHSLTDYPLEGVGGQREDHTHPNSLSHTDSRARSLSHPLTLNLTLCHSH